MTRRRKLLLAVLGGVGTVVVLLGAALWWVVLRDDTPEEATLVARQTVAPARTGLDGTWTVVPGAEVFAGYRITEHLNGLDNTAVARTGEVEATVEVEDGRITAVDAAVDMASLTSQDTELPGVGGRDDAMREAGLETGAFPTATFSLTEPLALGGLAEPGREVALDAVGVLELHGVARPVTVPVRARWSGEVIDLSASVEVALADFAIDPPAPQVVSVADRGTVELQLTVERAG